jgi:Transposase DDE domain
VFCCTVDHVEVAIVPACLDSLLIGLYVLADEFFIDRRGPGRPRKITDAELVCLAVAQVLLDCPGDRKFLAWARWRLGHLFPYLPKQPGYNKRIRALAPQVARLLNLLIFESTSIHDELWLIDGTPIACGQSRQTSRRSELAGYAAYGYCKSQHRHYWGFKLVLVCAPDGMPIGFELVAANVDERKAAAEILERIPAAGHIILADKGYAGQAFEQLVAGHGARLIRPDRRDEPAARLAGPGAPMDRERLRHAQRPALPRTPRRAHDARPARSSRHPSTRAGRRYTPQPTRRHLGPQPHRLRPLTRSIRNRSSSGPSRNV